MSSKTRALTKLERLNLEFDRVIQLIEPIDDLELVKKPTKDMWSVVQVFNHLYEVEQLSLDYLEYKELNGKPFPKVKFITKAKMIVYKIALLSPLKFKKPQNLSEPSNEGGLDSIQKEFENLRIKFNEFVERQDDTFFNTASYKHTIVGRVNIETMFEFLRLHLKHHEKQILRILIKIAK